MERFGQFHVGLETSPQATILIHRSSVDGPVDL